QNIRDPGEARRVRRVGNVNRSFIRAHNESSKVPNSVRHLRQTGISAGGPVESSAVIVPIVAKAQTREYVNGQSGGSRPVIAHDEPRTGYVCAVWLDQTHERNGIGVKIQSRNEHQTAGAVEANRFVRRFKAAVGWRARSSLTRHRVVQV